MIRCLCGGRLSSVVADTGGDTSRAITYQCGNCRRHLVLQLNLRLLPRNGCGSNAGYQHHIDHGEAPCMACKQARADYMAQRRRKVAS